MVSAERIKTNKCLMKAFNLEDFLDPSKLTHEELAYYNLLSRSFDKTINTYLEWLDTKEAQQLFYEDIQYNEQLFKDVDIHEIINDTSVSANKIIEKVYEQGLKKGYKDIRRRYVLNEPAERGLIFLKDYNFQLIKNVNDDLAKTIRGHIAQGVAEGQSMYEVQQSILETSRVALKDKTLSAYDRASMIARTETARAMSQGSLQAYANYGVKQVKILTAGDDNVCPICREAETKIFEISDELEIVPFHPCCRCSVTAHIKDLTDLPYEPIKNPEILCCAPLKRIGNTNYDDAKVNPETEFEDISNKGFIEYVDNNGRRHKIKVKCIESSIVEFGDEEEIGEKLDDEECYQYQILDENDNVRVNIYKSKTHGQFSMSHLMSIYDKLNSKLISGCGEIILSNQELKDKSGGFVLPSSTHRINIMGITDSYDIESVLIHEMAHSFDFCNNHLSNTKKYKELAKKFPSEDNPLDEDDSRYFSEDFAYAIESIIMFPTRYMVYGDEKTEYLYKLLGIYK